MLLHSIEAEVRGVGEMRGDGWVGGGVEELRRKAKGTGPSSPEGAVPPTDSQHPNIEEQEEGHRVLHKTDLETHLLELKVASFSEQYPGVTPPSCVNPV